MNHSCSSNAIMLNLGIGDQLTSLSCGHVVVELIKFIVYQRLQIPYTYQWLKHVVNAKKISRNEDKNRSLQSDRHFFNASTALENLDYILKDLLQEISGSCIPEEVCISLGATPVTCKEVYRLILPTVCHKPQCHSSNIASDQKIQRNVFKSLVTSDLHSQVFYNPLPPTNMYVFIKKKNLGVQPEVTCSENFIFTCGYRIPQKSKLIIIDFNTNNPQNLTCCNEFPIFGDNVESTAIVKCENTQSDDELREIESTDSLKWYQSTYIMKGFKDCIVNGSSITNLWLES